MSFITLDFETYYKTKNPGKYTLATMTYEEYIRDGRFKVHGVGIKIDTKPEYYFYGSDAQIKAHLATIFTPNNPHTMLCHNTLFDAAILCWHYNLRAQTYYCTQSMSQALWAQSSASLDQLAKRLFPDDRTLRKGKELESFDGVYELTDAQQQVMGGYCKQDVHLTFAAFAKMYSYFPNKELQIIDTTIKMFAHRFFVLETSGVLEYQKKLQERRAELIKRSGLKEEVLSSNKQFAEYLFNVHNIVVPMKASPTPKNPDNQTEALAKDDPEFIELQRNYPHLKHIWDARIVTKSNTELTRCAQLLSNAQVSSINVEGRIAVPLKYCGAHTKRWSGTNNVNFQNFKRKSPLRLALYAPTGFRVSVRDLSNIEGRMNAWFNDQEDKLELFRKKADIYNILGSSIYGKEINRKLKMKDAAGNYLDKNGNICEEKDAYEPFEIEGRVAKIAELGLGYGMGESNFANQLYINGVEANPGFARKVVETWRKKNYKIVAGWKKATQVIFDMARKDLVPYNWKCIRVEQERLVLPSGLCLTYPGLHYDESEKNFVYWNGKFWKKLYGGLLMENIIQAISRIVMTDMMVNINSRLREQGISEDDARCILTVHDELVMGHREELTDLVMKIMEEEMRRTPTWCDELLVLDSEGGTAENYSK